MTFKTYVGRPCSLGHTIRYMNGACVECGRARCKQRYHDHGAEENLERRLKYASNVENERSAARQRYWNNRATRLSAMKLRRESNIEQAREYDRARWPKRKENSAAYMRKWYANNKQRVYEANKKWRSENVEKARLMSLYHQTIRKRLLAAQPLATTYADAIKKIYAECPPGHHVDHIVPLRGKTVSGLHVPWNLQYLPAAKNLAKGNRLEAT